MSNCAINLLHYQISLLCLYPHDHHIFQFPVFKLTQPKMYSWCGLYLSMCSNTPMQHRMISSRPPTRPAQHAVCLRWIQSHTTHMHTHTHSYHISDVKKPFFDTPISSRIMAASINNIMTKAAPATISLFLLAFPIEVNLVHKWENYACMTSLMSAEMYLCEC